MLESDLVQPSRTAVVVIDMQNDFCHPDGKVPKTLGHHTAPIQAMAQRLIKFLADARRFNVPIIHVRRNERLEDIPENIRRIKEKRKLGSCCVPGTWGYRYYKITPRKNDVEFVKTGYDPFANPEFRKHLKSLKIKNIIFAGVFSPVCVDTSVRRSVSEGYNTILPQELTATTRELKNRHKASLDTLSELFAWVVPTREIIQRWQAPKN